jgi:hypothetical protein
MDMTPAAHDSTPAVQDPRVGMIVLSMWQSDTSSIVTAKLTRIDSTGDTVPLPNVTIALFVQRLFGVMPVSEDNAVPTDANGEAAIAFPMNIPGDEQGNVTLVARVQDNDQLEKVEGRAHGKWGVPVAAVKDPFPRALWEPQAPFALIVTFAILFGGVWITYAFVFSQLFRIKKG